MYPHYRPAELAAAFHLRHGWNAWPTAAHQFPPHMDRLLEQLAPTSEADGLRLLEYRCLPDQVQVLASVLPVATPVFCAQRMK